MLDQSFSTNNFEIIYGLENRKGNININEMPQEFRSKIDEIKSVKNEIRELRRKKKSILEQEQRERLDWLEYYLQDLKQSKEEILTDYLSSIADRVNNKSFQFLMRKFSMKKEDKEMEVFSINTDNHTALFTMKQLQYNIHKTFKVKQENRHSILSNIKTLLNSRVPVYVIRTDISSFYESIIQEKLFERINNNTLLNYKSRSFIKTIIKLYEDKKDQKIIPKGLGIPRGVGISAYLSELYLQNIDLKIRNKREVIFYARYVDDIFIILSTIPKPFKSLFEYYQELCNLFGESGLHLKKPNDGSNKCFLLDFSEINTDLINMDYLGYKLTMQRTNKEQYFGNFLPDT